MKNSSQYRAEACQILKGKWTAPVLATLFLLLCNVCLQWFIRTVDVTQITVDPVATLKSFSVVLFLVGLFMIFILVPYNYAYMISFAQLRNKPYWQTFWKCSYKKAFCAPMLVGLIMAGFLLAAFILAVILIMLSIRVQGSVSILLRLLAFILIFAGYVILIILTYGLKLAPLFVENNPDMPIPQAIRLCWDTMKGKKAKLFLLDLSFIGWLLLAILTCGIGVLWVRPYMTAAYVAFYEDITAVKPSADNIPVEEQ